LSADTSSKAFRTLDDADKIRDCDVNPYYVEDLKRRVSVARVGRNLFAFDDMYQGYPLSGGLLTGTTLMSQFDGSQFDLETGAVLRGPATVALKMYEVRERDGKIEVRL
jgi:nitrite reductase/ring-hydroxylating ferredoxin subunit